MLKDTVEKVPVTVIYYDEGESIGPVHHQKGYAMVYEKIDVKKKTKSAYSIAYYDDKGQLIKEKIDHANLRAQ